MEQIPDAQLNIRIPRALKSRLEHEAAEQGVLISELTRTFIEDGLTLVRAKDGSGITGADVKRIVTQVIRDFQKKR